MKVSIDRTGCISCGACVENCGEVFMLDGDGKASITEQFNEGNPSVASVPDNLRDCVKSAADNCPVDVISVE